MQNQPLKHVRLAAIILFLFLGKASLGQSQKGFGGYVLASFGNKNVYKTKIPLAVTKAYLNDTKVYIKPKGSLLKDSFMITPVSGNYIRYKVIAEEGDFKYIRILPGCQIKDSTIEITDKNDKKPLLAEETIFKVAKSLLEPNAHYLASSAIIGKAITLPVKVRKEYWNNNNVVLEPSLSLGMAFGWKLKLGNHPYRSHYISAIFYGAGVSQQKYFTTGKDLTGKDTVSTKTDEIAVTYLTMGLAYEYDRLNIGIFWGRDKMFGALKSWAYQDKSWFGIGVGYDLFK